MRYQVFARLLATLCILAFVSCGGGGGGSGSAVPAPQLGGAPQTDGNLTTIVYPANYERFWRCSGCTQPAAPYPFGPISVSPTGTTFYFLDWNYLTIELNGGNWLAFVTRSYTYQSQQIAGFAFTAYDALGNLYGIGASSTTSYLIAHADAPSGQVFTPVADDTHDMQASGISGRILLASGLSGVEVVDNAASGGIVHRTTLSPANCAHRIVENANHDIFVSSCVDYSHIFRYSSSLRLIASAQVADAVHINEIAPDTDGGVWFADDYANRYGKMSATGRVTEYSPPSGYTVSAVATLSNGSIWFALSNAGVGYLAKADESGHLTMQQLPAGLVQAEYLRGSYDVPGIMPNHLYFLDKYGNVGVIAVQ